MQGCWDCWRDAAAELAEKRALLRVANARWYRTTLSSAFARWDAAASGAWAERTLLERHAASTRRALPAFAAWREAAGRAAAHRRGRILEAHERRPLCKRVLQRWRQWSRERRELYGRG